MNIASNPVGRFVRDRIVVRLFGLPGGPALGHLHHIAAMVSYRKGPLGGRKPRPGDRVADLQCYGEDGTLSRLHAELGGRSALLAPQDAVMYGAEAARPRLDRQLGVCTYSGTDAMLVRPDAHLGWRGDPNDVDVVYRDGPRKKN